VSFIRRSIRASAIAAFYVAPLAFLIPVVASWRHLEWTYIRVDEVCWGVGFECIMAALASRAARPFLSTTLQVIAGLTFLFMMVFDLCAGQWWAAARVPFVIFYQYIYPLVHSRGWWKRSHKIGA
jgi:hypothetical protein